VRYVKKRRERVGIRELRQNLSVYLKRVAAGETLEVTERNRPVAILAPLPEASTPLGRLVATGRARAPVGDLLELGAPNGEPASTRLSEALAEEQEDRLA
jgi:prevent-host-death family protein